MSDSSIRYALTISALLTLVLAVGFYQQWAWATRFWPWEDGRMSYIFISSILAAVAAPILWIALTGAFRASEPGAIDLAISGTGAGLYLAWLAIDGRGMAVTVAAGAFLMIALVQVGVYRWCRQYTLKDQRAMPLPVRVSFGVFAVALLMVGSALVLQADHIFPWPLRSDSSVIFGWIFLGAAAYFIHGVLRPSWANAAGQLLGFLAYDVVLIWPFLDHFDTVTSAHRTSLIVYTSVIIYSAVLAIYYLLINPGTRLWQARQTETEVPPHSALGTRS
jgi:hypothetical protein